MNKYCNIIVPHITNDDDSKEASKEDAKIQNPEEKEEEEDNSESEEESEEEEEDSEEEEEIVCTELSEKERNLLYNYYSFLIKTRYSFDYTNQLILRQRNRFSITETEEMSEELIQCIDVSYRAAMLQRKQKLMKEKNNNKKMNTKTNDTKKKKDNKKKGKGNDPNKPEDLELPFDRVYFSLVLGFISFYKYIAKNITQAIELTTTELIPLLNTLDTENNIVKNSENEEMKKKKIKYRYDVRFFVSEMLCDSEDYEGSVGQLMKAAENGYANVTLLQCKKQQQKKKKSPLNNMVYCSLEMRLKNVMNGMFLIVLKKECVGKVWDSLMEMVMKNKEEEMKRSGGGGGAEEE